jgi:leader peptidase (prepilin peptidase)/N-methyltransferase
MALQLPTENAPTSMKKIRSADLIVGLTGLVAAAASIWAVSGANGFLGAGLALLMLAIAVVDYRYFIIPNELTAAALALAVINAVLAQAPSMVESVAAAALRGAITMLFFLALRWLYGWLRQREGLGLGDVKLAFVAGAWLDWLMIPVAIEIAALAALMAYGAWQLFGRRPVNATSRLPFGLFFAPAIWLSWLLGAVIFAF